MNSNKSIIYIFFTTILIPVVYTARKCPRKNACPKINDYPFIYIQPKCYYYADMDLDTPELIDKYLIQSEEHKIITDDGYILTAFRIPQKRNIKPKKVVLLSHALFTTSRVFIGQGEESLAYFLWHLGYEIWLDNMRGTHFSNWHINLTPKDRKFYQFSVDEGGKYDLAAEIRYIRNHTNVDKITYVGYSMGTAKAFAYASLYPEEAEKSIDRFIMLATTVIFRNSNGPLTVFAKFEPIAKKIADFFQADAHMANIIKKLNNFCYTFPPFVTAFYHLNNLFMGPTTVSDPKQINMDAFRNFDATSVNTISHLLQLMRVKKQFQAYDFGKIQNMKVYGTTRPPVYAIGNITIPMLFIGSDRDLVGNIKDAEYLVNNVMPKNPKTYLFRLKGLNHLDYAIGKLQSKQPYFDKIKEYLEW